MFFNCFSLDGNLRNSLNKGINYLAENWDSIDHKVNPHSLALVTYALHLALHPEKDQVGLYFPYTSSITFCKGDLPRNFDHWFRLTKTVLHPFPC